MFRPIASPIASGIARAITDVSGSAPTPEFPVLRVPAAITVSTSPSGSASWDSPAELQTGDRVLLMVSGGPNSPSIGTSGGFTEFATPLTTLQGVFRVVRPATSIPLGATSET